MFTSFKGVDKLKHRLLSFLCTNLFGFIDKLMKNAVT